MLRLAPLAVPSDTLLGTAFWPRERGSHVSPLVDNNHLLSRKGDFTNPESVLPRVLPTSPQWASHHRASEVQVGRGIGQPVRFAFLTHSARSESDCSKDVSSTTKGGLTLDGHTTAKSSHTDPGLSVLQNHLAFGQHSGASQSSSPTGTWAFHITKFL